MPPPVEEVVPAIEYVRCPVCFGGRCDPSAIWHCKTCGGWGFTISPASEEERIALGLRALWSSCALELASQPKKRLRLPLRKRRKVSDT